MVCLMHGMTELCKYDEAALRKKPRANRNRGTSTGSPASTNQNSVPLDESVSVELQEIKSKIAQLGDLLASKISGKAPSVNYNLTPDRAEGNSTIADQQGRVDMTSYPQNIPQYGIPPSVGSPIIGNYGVVNNSLGGAQQFPNPGYTNREHSALDPVVKYSSERNRELFLAQSLGVNADDVIDFYEGSPTMMMWYSRVNNHGPLSWVAIVLKDPFLVPINRIVMGQKKTNTLKLPGWIRTRAVPTSDKDEEFAKQVMERTGIAEIKPFGQDDNIYTRASGKYSDERFKEEHRKKAPKERKGKEFAAHESKGKLYCLKKQILQALPSRKVTWMLFDRFFKYVYPFWPHLDENLFTAEVEEIIGKRAFDESKVTQLNIKKKLDFATLGSLLLVLELGSLSLTHNCEKTPDFPMLSPQEVYLRSHPINSNLAEVAQICIDQFHLLSRCALSLFQCLLLMKVYQCTTGSDGFNDGRQQIFLSLIIQVGISIGLNRDPEKFTTVGDSDRTAGIIRKIWYSLESYSTIQSTTLGCPNQIDPNLYDTKLPVFMKNTANVNNLAIEEETVTGLIMEHKLTQVLNSLLSLVLNLKSPPRVGQVLSKLEEVSDYIRERWSSLANLLTPTDGDHTRNLRKVRSVLCYIESASTIHPVYYHMLLLYGKKKNAHACLRIAKKLLSYSMELVAHFVDLMRHGYRYFGPGFDFFLNSFLEVAIQRCLQIQISLYVRSCCLKKKLEEEGTPENSSLMRKIEEFKNGLMKRNFANFLNGLKPVANRSFFAWLLMRAPTFIFKLLQNGKIKFPKTEYNFLVDLTEEEISDLYSCANPDRYKNEYSSSGQSTGNTSYPDSDPSSTEIDNFWKNVVNQGNAKQKDPLEHVETSNNLESLNWKYMNEFNADPLELGILGDMGFGESSGSMESSTSNNDTGIPDNQFAPQWNQS